MSNSATPEDLQKLRRKLAETEARLVSRLLLTAQEVLPPLHLKALVDRFGENRSLDLLEMERFVADAATQKANLYEDVYEAAAAYREAKRVWDDRARTANDDESEAVWAEAHLDMLRKRERMFSLVAEIELKQRIEKDLQA